MAILGYFLIFAAICELYAIPVVLKESTPNGESVIAFSSSDPREEKYFLDYATKRGAKQHIPVNQAYTPNTDGGAAVRSFSITTPQRTVAGTGRSFGYNQPIFLPFFNTDLQPFEFDNWFRNIEENNDPSYFGKGVSASAAVVSNNGQVYSRVETSHGDRQQS